MLPLRLKHFVQKLVGWAAVLVGLPLLPYVVGRALPPNGGDMVFYLRMSMVLLLVVTFSLPAAVLGTEGFDFGPMFVPMNSLGWFKTVGFWSALAVLMTVVDFLWHERKAKRNHGAS